MSPTWSAALSVTPEALERQLRRLVARGYRGATFAGALVAPPGRRVLAVTFDDAYRSVLELGFPVLERLGLPGTVFVPTGFAGTDRPMSWPGIEHWTGTRHEQELVPLSWPQLRDLTSAGWEVGSHTVSHPRLTRADDTVLASELRASRLACEAGTGRPCAAIAYPYGDVDARVVAAAREAGYAFGAALPATFHRPRPLEWPRVGVYHTDSERRFRVKASRAVRMLRATMRH